MPCLTGCLAWLTGGSGSDKTSKGIGRANFIADNVGSIDKAYDLDRTKQLGEGAFGSVCRAKEKVSGKAVAVKAVRKKQAVADKLRQEIAIMKILDHPNLIKLFETFQDNQTIYIVQELCLGGELFDRIVDAGHFSERQAAVLMQQIMRGIFYMHQSRVAHRDLKPENFLLSSRESIERSPLKIIDFGLSCKIKDGQALKTKAGTPYYVAPQVLSGSYTEACDVWSCGTIMLVLLCGYPPFQGNTDNEILTSVRRGFFSFSPATSWEDVSSDAKALIVRMLKRKESERCTAGDACRDAWLVQKLPPAASKPLHHDFVNNLARFRSQNKLKRAALQIVAAQLDEAEIRGLRDTFMSLDANGDGMLTYAELKAGLAHVGQAALPADFEKMVESIDANASGSIDYTEFLAAALDKRHVMQRDACWQAFRSFDRDGNGKIERGELRKVVGNADVVTAVGGVDAVADILQRVDKDGDGAISFDEFMEMMQTSE